MRQLPSTILALTFALAVFGSAVGFYRFWPSVGASPSTNRASPTAAPAENAISSHLTPLRVSAVSNEGFEAPAITNSEPLTSVELANHSPGAAPIIAQRSQGIGQRARRKSPTNNRLFQADAENPWDEIEISVPPSAPFPAVLLQTNAENDPAATRTEAQRKLADRLATEFAEDVKQSEGHHPDAGNSPEANEQTASENWERATNKSNDKFRSLFGRQAYIRENIRQYQLRK